MVKENNIEGEQNKKILTEIQWENLLHVNTDISALDNRQEVLLAYIRDQGSVRFILSPDFEIFLGIGSLGTHEVLAKKAGVSRHICMDGVFKIDSVGNIKFDYLSEGLFRNQTHLTKVFEAKIVLFLRSVGLIMK